MDVTELEQLGALQTARQGLNGSDPLGGYRVSYKGEGASRKLVLPEMPAHDDALALCRWLTCVFNLNPAQPVTSAVHQGLRGPAGHVAIRRAAAPEIRFEPATRINNPPRLIEDLSWFKLPTDGAIYPLRAEHCRDISHVIVMLCGHYGGLDAAQEAEAIVGEVLLVGMAVEGCTTHGTSAQRFEAAMRLRRDVDEVTGRRIGPPRYLIDAGSPDRQTGELVGRDELVIAVSDLQEAARRHIGSSLPHGWLDSRMEELTWQRIRLEGHERPRPDRGRHRRIDAYRGVLPNTDRDDEQ